MLGGAITLAGAGAHAAAGGLLPEAPVLLMLLGAVVLACAATLGRELTATRVVALTVGGQVVVHTTLSVLAGHGSGGMGGMGDLGAHGAHTAADTPAAAGALRHLLLDPVQQPWMTAAHLGAAALVGAWLAVGERALWSLLRAASSRAVAVVTGFVPAVTVFALPTRTPSATAVVPLPPRSTTWARVVARRGPPAGLLAR